MSSLALHQDDDDDVDATNMTSKVDKPGSGSALGEFCAKDDEGMEKEILTRGIWECVWHCEVILLDGELRMRQLKISTCPV